MNTVRTQSSFYPVNHHMVRQTEQNVPQDDVLPIQNHHCHSNQIQVWNSNATASPFLRAPALFSIVFIDSHFYNCDLWGTFFIFLNGLNKTSVTPNPHESLSWEEHKRWYLAKCSNFFPPIQWIQTRSTGRWLKASKLLLCSTLVLWV